MKPRFALTLLLSSPDPLSHEYQLDLDEETMCFSLQANKPEINDAIPDELTEWGAEERQGPFSIKIVDILYKGIETSQEVKDAEQERIQGILDMMVKTALPDR